MAPSQRENRVAVSATNLLLTSMISAILCAGSAVCAEAQDAQPNTNESWTATTQTSADNASPSRTTESHVKSGNRTVDKQRMEVLGPDGRYQPDSDTEKETIEVNATTTRTVVRTYRWDANGRRYLVQVMDEAAQKLSKRRYSSGTARLQRIPIACQDWRNLQLVQRCGRGYEKDKPGRAGDENHGLPFGRQRRPHSVCADAGVGKAQR